MIDRKHGLSLVKQCEALELARSSIYYKPKGESEENLKLMRLIDEVHLNRPFLGIRRVKDELVELGYPVNHKRVRRLMGLLGIEAIYPKPNLSKRDAEHKIYPYLLRGMEIDKPNQVWAADITYVPMDKGFVYLVAVMDWYSRRVLSWKLSNTLDANSSVEAVEEAIERFGKPEIFNTDQGSQFTSEVFVNLLKQHEICISMDGKGAWRDNVFVERLWRSLKYEEVYLKAYESMMEARDGIGEWVDYYNSKRIHQTLRTTPDRMYGIVSGDKRSPSFGASGRLKNSQVGNENLGRLQEEREIENSKNAENNIKLAA